MAIARGTKTPGRSNEAPTLRPPHLNGHNCAPKTDVSRVSLRMFAPLSWMRPPGLEFLNGLPGHLFQNLIFTHKGESRHCERSEAISCLNWMKLMQIASSQSLLAMTVLLHEIKANLYLNKRVKKYGERKPVGWVRHCWRKPITKNKHLFEWIYKRDNAPILAQNRTT